MMAETGESHAQRSQYPPSEEHGSGQYYNQGSPRGPSGPPRDERSAYPPPGQQQGPPHAQPQDPSRQGQYPPGPYPPDPRAQGHYAQPPPGHYGPPPPGYPQYDPNHPPQNYHYPYAPGPPHGQGPPQPTQPDPWRLPPPVPPYYHQGYGYPPPQAPAPRQRTAIACKYCRKRKIRCSGYDSASDGRCANCVRFNQECLFHPVSSQTTFVPASAVYGPNGVGRGQPQQLYGAHGQPLGPAAGQGQQTYQYPPPGQYPPQPYSPAGPPYAQQQGAPPQGQGYPQAPEGENSNVRKRGPPDDDPHNEGAHASSQSPHPSSRPRTSVYEPRANSNGGYEHNGEAPISPAGSAMSYQSHPAGNAPHQYTNGHANGHQNTNSPPAGLTPQSAHTPGGSFNSPHALPIREDGKTSPQPGSASSSTNGRNGMSIHDMVGGPSHGGADQRARNDVDALKKLDGKK